MGSPPPVVLVDDGELEPVRLLLEDVGAELERIRASEWQGPVIHPAQLLVASAAAASALKLNRTLAPQLQRATWIAFVLGESRTQRAALQKAGFDFLVREPVHPAALRVLFQRALFRGSDSRRVPRVAFGYPVRYRTGLFSRNAMLVDLSPRGCRLLVRASLREKTAVRVEIPRELAQGKTLVLPGHVVRVSTAVREGVGDQEFSIGIRFAALGDRLAVRLRDVLAERVIGPAALSVAVPLTPGESRPAEVKAPPRGSAPPPRKRRRSARAKFEKTVTALAGDDAYAILCRDLSVGGMKIERVDGLAVGAKLNLAIQLNPPREPVLVETTVLRDDGDGSLALGFDWLSADSRRQLERLLATLPAIESLQEDTDSQGTILARRLSRSPRPG
jgi:PilZ domain-containing protein